jgi:hypothetical protein
MVRLCGLHDPQRDAPDQRPEPAQPPEKKADPLFF